MEYRKGGIGGSIDCIHHELKRADEWMKSLHTSRENVAHYWTDPYSRPLISGKEEEKDGN